MENLVLMYMYGLSDICTGAEFVGLSSMVLPVKRDLRCVFYLR